MAIGYIIAPKRRAAHAPKVGVGRGRGTILRRRWRAESRVLLHNLSWSAYLKIDRAFGDDNRPGILLNYLDGTLEIMSTSDDHEHVSKIIGMCIEAYCFERDIYFRPQGRMTRRAEDKTRGAEADESYSFDRETHRVQLVTEIVISSGSLDKLDLYEGLDRPEVWFWKRGSLQPYAHDGTSYLPVAVSTMLPGIDLKLIAKLSCYKDAYEALQEFRRHLKSGRR